MWARTTLGVRENPKNAKKRVFWQKHVFLPVFGVFGQKPGFLGFFGVFWQKTHFFGFFPKKCFRRQHPPPIIQEKSLKGTSKKSEKNDSKNDPKKEVKKER